MPSNPEIRQRLILIADSEAQSTPVLRLRDLLEAEGFSVHLESDGFTALQWLQDNDDVPDLIIVDMLIPRLTGLELLKVIRYLGQRHVSELRKIYVMATTVNKDSRIMADAVSAGAKTFLYKPWNVTDLIMKIKKALHSVP